MKIKSLYFVLLFAFLGSCNKDDQSELCLAQNTVETLIGYQEKIEDQLTHAYYVDNNNRLNKVRTTSLYIPDWISVDNYKYDNEGRIIKIETESSHSETNKMITHQVFEYNDLGQLEVAYTYLNESWGLEEISRYEYTYNSDKQLESYRKFFRDELAETQDYTYTNGLMIGVKVKEINEDQELDYEVELKYDDKKPPYIAFDALQAIKVNWGYPHQHNIISQTAKLSDGSIYTSQTYKIDYTYSERGYPTRAEQVYPQGSNFVKRKWDYSYMSCN
jgi:hypothetical protein